MSENKIHRVVIASVLCALPLLSQGTRALVSGRIENMDSSPNLYVELHELGSATVTEKETVGADGTFRFREMPCGSYEVRVVSALHNDILLQEFTDVNPLGAQLVLRLPTLPETRPVSGLVSVRELQSRVPKKAFQAFVKAQHYAETSRPDEAIGQLRKAIQLDPDWRDPHVNLGAELVRTGRYPEALAELEEAIRIGPPSAMVYTNYGATLATVGRFPEAEKAVREAIRTDASFRRARYLLGHILALQPGREQEALDQLRAGAEVVPSGRLIASQVLLRRGDRAGAIAELQAYLRSGDKAHRAQAQKSLAGLQP